MKVTPIQKKLTFELRLAIIFFRKIPFVSVFVDKYFYLHVLDINFYEYHVILCDENLLNFFFLYFFFTGQFFPLKNLNYLRQRCEVCQGTNSRIYHKASKFRIDFSAAHCILDVFGHFTLCVSVTIRSQYLKCIHPGNGLHFTRASSWQCDIL